MKPVLTALSILGLLATMACAGAGGAGGASSGGSSGGSYQPVTGVVVSPSGLPMVVGASQVFNAVPVGPEAFAYGQSIVWTASDGTLTATTGSTTTWTAPATGTASSHWVKASSTVNPAASTTVAITLLGSGTPDQDNLGGGDPNTLGDLDGALFAVGTASPVDQSFRPARPTLTGVSLCIGVLNAQYGDDTATLKIKAADGNLVGSSSQPVVLSQFAGPYGLYQNRIVFFPFQELALTPEASYFLVLEGGRHTFVWRAFKSNTYGRGAGRLNSQPLANGGDFLFRTYAR